MAHRNDRLDVPHIAIILRRLAKFLIFPIIIYLLFIPWSDSIALGQDYSKDWLIAKFNTLDNAINHGEGYGNDTNEFAVLAWGESYILQAYLDMYQATKNKKYIEKFISQAKKVYQNTDSARNIKDYKGKKRSGWSATKYSKHQEPVVHIVHTGMVLYPLVKFSLMVKQDATLATYKDWADKFTELGEKAAREIDDQWGYNASTGEGSYRFVGDEPLKFSVKGQMPFNGQLAFGRVLIALYKITGKESYLSKARALATMFKRHLVTTPQGAYVWGYAPSTKITLMEDISHGGIDVDFAVEAAQANIVFNRTDLERFAKTILNAKKNNKFVEFVDGSGDDPKDIYSSSSGPWLELSAVNCRVYGAVAGFLLDRVKQRTRETPQGLLGLAKLTKYFDQCHAKQ